MASDAGEFPAAAGAAPPASAGAPAFAGWTGAGGAAAAGGAPSVGFADRGAKRRAVLDLLAERGASSLLLTSTPAISWYLDGARVHINLAAGPIVEVLVTPAGDQVHLQSNERERMIAEELPPEVTVHARAWHESPALTADILEADVERELRDLRRALSPAETARLRAVGTDAASVLTDALHLATPEMTEHELAALVASGLIARGADPIVILAQGASRSSIRHPLPTSAPLGRRAMLVVCARRHGLIANATRWVRFGSATAEESDADARILEVEADVFAALAPGVTLAAVLAGVAASYPAHGFADDEWLQHHQGGAAGWDTRDPVATPSADDRLVLGQALAFNPTGPGCKVEDTVQLTEHGIDVLTVDPRWPATLVRGILRPRVLER